MFHNANLYNVGLMNSQRHGGQRSTSVTFPTPEIPGAAVNHGYSFNYSIAALPKRSLSKLLLVTIREHPPPREMPDLSIGP